MFFYIIEDSDFCYKLNKFTGISVTQNSSFLMYKKQKGETLEEAHGHYIMYVVDQASSFEKICKENGIRIRKLPVDEQDYRNHFETYRKGKIRLNEELLNSFDGLERFVKSIAKPHSKLQITDSYSFSLTILQVNKISKWLNDNQMNEIEFIVPRECQNKMASIVSEFASKGITVTFKTMHIHGRYWIVDNLGFLVDASVNATKPFIGKTLCKEEVLDIRAKYLI